MSEQLSMDFSSPASSERKSAEESSYEHLDFQLAALMQELNEKADKTLSKCTLEISKHTREGQIAYACSEDQQAALLNTKVVGEAGDYKPLILENGYLYLRRYWQYQTELAKQINKRLQVVEGTTDSWLNDRLDHYFGVDSDEIDWQKIAAKQALNHDFLILSGGPGTGKTTTITRILALLIEQNSRLKDSKKYTSPLFSDFVEGSAKDNKERGLRILLAAPTGKAAIRMVDAIRHTQKSLNLPAEVAEQMPKQASTIHKLLGYIHAKAGFKHNRNNPLNADVVLVDEASMIDIALMSKLFEAVPAKAKLILIGDKDQLASVETGSVFADICTGLNSLSPAEGGLGSGEKIENLITLQKNWRFKQDSGIGQLAKATNQGDDKKSLEILKDKNKAECQLISPHILDNNRIAKELIEPWEHYFKTLNDPNKTIVEVFEAFNHYRILCALRRGLNGSQIMNTRIEAQLVKQGLIKIKKAFGQNQQGSAWYHGRPLMITQNDYSKGLFNGDTGIALIENGQTKVYFPDSNENAGFKAYSPVRLPAHETTWAMTIHKSQGSEFNQVTLILPHEEMPLLTRQLIYTGITRAKTQVNIVANDLVLRAGVRSKVVRATRIGDPTK